MPATLLPSATAGLAHRPPQLTPGTMPVEPEYPPEPEPRPPAPDPGVLPEEPEFPPDAPPAPPVMPNEPEFPPEVRRG